MRRLAKSTIRRSLVAVTTTPFAVVAGLYFLDAEHRTPVFGGVNGERPKASSWQLGVGAGGSGVRPARGGPGLAAAGSGSRDGEPGDSRGPGDRSQVIGGGRGQGGSGGDPGSARRDGPGGGPGSSAGGTGGASANGKKTGPVFGPVVGGPGTGGGATSQLTGATAGDGPSQGQAPPRLEDLPPGTGLLAQYFDHESELKKIPNLDISGATLTRLDPAVNFAADGWDLPFYPLETWATCWRGYLKVLVEGHYTFVLGSDDGALLELDNKPICGADRLQGYSESRGEVDLTKALHVLKLRFFNNRGPGACKLFWIAPGTTEPAIIPTEVLYPAGGAAEVGRPSITALGPDGARRGERIKITGTNFSDIPSLNKVTFGPLAFTGVVEEASATELTVVVPNGVDQGPIAVSVGDLTTPAVPYNVGGFFGLYARYWHDTSGQGVADYASPTTSVVPDDEQLVGPLDLRSRGAFKLPFTAEQVRACYVGRFWAQTAGQHGFGLESDDGSRLVIDGQPVVDNGGSHGRKRVDGALFLSAGWHDIEVDYFQGVGDANLTLLHGDPDKPLVVCPRGLLAPPIDMDTRVTPQVTGLNPNPTKAGDRLLISGGGLVAPDGKNPVVTLNGKALPVVAASPGTVAVDVPFGFDSGPLVVRAGPLAAAAVDLTVTGYGIKAEYWQSDSPITVMPAFDTPAKLTRVEDKVDYQEDVAFKFPWNRDHFAARWSGKVYAPVDGTYELATGSDDGSLLYVDHQKVVDNDGLHGYVEVGSQVQLTAGLHTIVLTFYENEGEARCRLLWKPPGAKNRVVIPRSNLVPAD